MDKNTQQQASWEYFDGTWHVGVDGERENYEMFGYPTRDLHTAPPVPRDVLMAFGEEIADKAHEAGFIGNTFTNEDIAAIADRYASQVQAVHVMWGMDKKGVLALAAEAAQPVDKGPWRHGIAKGITKVRVFIESDDFTHDVRLYVDGDFADTAERVAYAKGIAQQLNAAQQPTSAKPMAVPDERAAFEAWAAKEYPGLDVRRQNLLGTYTKTMTEWLYTGWQARAMLSAGSIQREGGV